MEEIMEESALEAMFRIAMEQSPAERVLRRDSEESGIERALRRIRAELQNLPPDHPKRQELMNRIWELEGPARFAAEARQRRLSRSQAMTPVSSKDSPSRKAE
jgi:hypothetical protein